MTKFDGIPVEESVQKMADVISKATSAQSGKFYNHLEKNFLGERGPLHTSSEEQYVALRTSWHRPSGKSIG